MKKLKMHTENLTEQNIEKIQAIFPNCITESAEIVNEERIITKKIDFELLRQELSSVVVEGSQERYRLDWPGKREALLTANTPIAKTLRPVPEESVNFDTTQNVFIEGDNLDALKILQNSYLNKIKMIYIDPPYNTGNDFIYEDDFAENPSDYLLRSNQTDEEGNRLRANTESNGRFHSDWLSMMYSRLKLARNLLRDDGVIFISIDDGEVHNLRKICDEIFGEDNFVANVIWEKKYAPSNDAKWFSDNHDHILVISKNKNSWYPQLLPRTEEANQRYTNRDNDPRGPWKSSDFSVKTYSENYDYEITTPSGRKVSPPMGRSWVTSKEKYLELVSENRIWFGESGENVPSIKRFLTDVKDGIVPLTIWKYTEVGHNQIGRQELKKLFDDKGFFDGPKPVSLITRIIQLSVPTSHPPCENCPPDIILDFFAGSATTAHSVMQLNSEDCGNRKFILVQLPEITDEKSEAFKAGYKTIAEISKERIRRAGKKTLSEYTEKQKNRQLTLDGGESENGAEWDQDIGFRVFKVDSSNMRDIYYTPDDSGQPDLKNIDDNIKEDRSTEDLLFQVMLDWDLPITYPVRKVKLLNKYEVLLVHENSLVACFLKKGEVSEELCEEIARMNPLKVVFRDAGFESDSVKINVAQIFKTLSPGSDIRSI
jgi:adenine-specific DNA-methyltransferase